MKNALELREKLLLRQLDLVYSFHDEKTSRNESEISFHCENEEKILDLLRSYGVYQNIESFLPYLENENETHDDNFLFEKSFPSSLMENNRKVSASIINLTLRESQNLIRKSQSLVTSVSDALKMDPAVDKNSPFPIPDNHNQQQPKSIKQPKNEVKAKNVTAAAPEEGSKLKRNDNTTSSKKKTLKNISNLTLNSCGGSIILKNITNLTINSCKSASSSSTHSAVAATAPKAISEPDDNCSDSKCDGNYYQCDFYDRLISQNEALKRSIVNQSLCTTNFRPDPIAATCMSPTGLVQMNLAPRPSEKRDDETFSINSSPDDTMSSITSSIAAAAAVGDDDKLTVVDEASTRAELIEEISTSTMMRVDGFSDHSPMIQCWLSKMMLEPEIDEAQHIAEILEISNIV